MSKLKTYSHSLAVFAGALLLCSGLNLSPFRSLAVLAGIVLLIEFWGKS